LGFSTYYAYFIKEMPEQLYKGLIFLFDLQPSFITLEYESSIAENIPVINSVISGVIRMAADRPQADWTSGNNPLQTSI